MQVVKLYENRMDAEIAKGFLENNGIKAFIMSDTGAGVHPELAERHSIKLCVADEEVESAQEILKSVDSDPINE